MFLQFPVHPTGSVALKAHLSTEKYKNCFVYAFTAPIGLLRLLVWQDLR